ncbi:hypothetical protein NG782_10325 [Aliarcobacter cryaerophilus]|jgi:hypothetical protein|uniref:hypothetical protein n=1 Tax=Aliarcobacter TaxID=2321111 RepID=UPI0029AF2608|nr:hypothetical protein [Aliarcobacter skirrowii]MDX4026771.1 hypothetical protein [Aliarcobacter skirrowii]
MYKLTEVQEYLKNILSAQRVEQCYKLISNPKERVNTEDEQWVACEQEHELKTVLNAINEILEEDGHDLLNHQDVLFNIIEEICELFQKNEITHKPRIPFYVLVLDRVIAE